MEVAGQWRREWAGAAEYGKVIEGGVTRQVARAMEVMSASTPGARMRVVRAAYHSSSGPGAPASSYMMHSSRRVISSGTRLLSPSLTSRPFGDTPSLPSLPLEISSTPLDILPDSPETENYKVTEPDDSEISAPSKWKGSADKNSIRMPSEESSSTDNASIIDLDPRTNHNNVIRKYSYDSENSDIPSMKMRNRASPLLDAPVTLSTLKYKSLLNGSNDWNNRRKSYSFEETAPLHETISHSNDTLAMESSTDSGICKSTEIVSDHEYERKDRKYDTHDDTFKGWLHKNRQTSFNTSNSFKSCREHNVVIEEPSESNITLQSTGKVSITVPITIADDYQHKQGHVSNEVDRRVKKVDFCKTELHFAAESGRVNIIATDEKPPPTNDFRRKKSTFMSISNKPERPITLFGEKKIIAGDVMIDDLLNHNNSEMGEFDENTAATKSILKNKIPKPKPYLLGENMAFGLIDDRASTNKSTFQSETGAVPTAVSLINRQLQSERRYSNDTTSSFSSETDTAPKRIISRPIDAGLTKSVCSKSEEVKINQNSTASEVTNTFNSAKNKFKALQMSPIPTRSKTRQLRQSDLTYFGIQNDNKNTPDDKPKFIRDRIKMQNDAIDNIFQSVRLIQQVSNSVCNSEAESEEAVEYQNVPFKTNFAPVPTPRSRTKYADKSDHNEKDTILKPIIEQDSKIVKQNSQVMRRSRSRKYEELDTPTIRSISEPPKANKNTAEKLYRRHNHIQQSLATRTHKYEKKDEEVNKNGSCTPDTAKLYLSDEDEEDLAPIYMNVNRDVINDNKAKITNGISCKLNTSKKLNDRNGINISDYKENNRSQCNSHDQIHKAEIHKGSINNKTNTIKKKKVQKAESQDVPCADQQSSEHPIPARKTASPDKKKNKRKDEKTTSIQKRGGSFKRAEHTSEQTIGNINNAHEIKDLKGLESTNEVLKSQNVRNTSRHSTAKKDTLEHQKRSSINSTDRHRNSLQIKSGERNGEVRYSKERPKSKRNEYVINYDDKNGTVTSICKIPDLGSAKKKKTLLEKVKESPKENKAKHKMSEKINLLQFPDRERNPSRLSHAPKRSNTKVHIQRSCQLL